MSSVQQVLAHFALIDDREGIVGATFVPAAGPIPFAWIGAFRWLLPQTPANGNGATPKRAGANIGRNDPCYCGSGKKYKKCHGASA